MAVLFGPSYRVALGNRLKKVSKSLIILSAYVKTAGLQWVAQNIDHKEAKITIVTRWQPHDLSVGASDIEAYELAQDLGWCFGISNHLHSKLFLMDHTTLFLGSANLTTNGLHLNGTGNDEAGVEIEATEEDRSRIDTYLDYTLWINEEIYQKFKSALLTIPKNKMVPQVEWPNNIKILLESLPSSLYVNEFLFSTPEQLLKLIPTKDCVHDIELLGIKDESALGPMEFESIVRQRVAHMRVWRWLAKVVQTAGEQSVRFGELSVRVHDVLADDPKPYRKEVKGLVANLFEWVRWMNQDIMIETYTHTKALRSK